MFSEAMAPKTLSETKKGMTFSVTPSIVQSLKSGSEVVEHDVLRLDTE